MHTGSFCISKTQCRIMKNIITLSIYLKIYKLICIYSDSHEICMPTIRTIRNTTRAYTHVILMHLVNFNNFSGTMKMKLNLELKEN